jgi:hypothetical protein
MIKKWPLHPRPSTYELLSHWIETLAKIYGVSYSNFCKNVLGLEAYEISSLNRSIPEKAIIILANGTGMPVNDLNKRDLDSTLEKLKQATEKEIEKNPDAFAAWLKPRNN